MIRRIIKWTWIPLTCAAALFIGLTIGYVYIGKQSFREVLDISTWRHMFDLIFFDS
ncbi:MULTISPECIES: DNA-directed RNA polymerase subunit beta [unclassified Paenibacillus]